MCTLTVLRDADRVLVTMNRDERRDRAPEISPRVSVDHSTGVAWAGPRDGAAGGTWMGANEFGVVACLLNQYASGSAPPRDPSRPSRGAIVPALLARGSWGNGLAWLDSDFDPTAYDGFRLVLVNAEETVLVVWTGTGDLEIMRPPTERFFLSSSSWNQEEVLPWRRARFEEWCAAGAKATHRIPSIHLLRSEGMESWAPLMAREHSATRSITQVDLGRHGHGLRVRWWPVADGRVAAEPEGEAALALRTGSEGLPVP